VEEIVIPDVMYDYKKTNELIHKFLDELIAWQLQIPFKLNAVVCGKTKKQVMQCFFNYMHNPLIDVISFSRRGYTYDGCNDVTRCVLVKDCINEMRSMGIFKPIHLLGANGIKDYYRNWPAEVRSIDSKQIANTILGSWSLNTKVVFSDRVIFRRLARCLKERV